MSNFTPEQLYAEAIGQNCDTYSEYINSKSVDPIVRMELLIKKILEKRVNYLKHQEEDHEKLNEE